MKKATYVLHSPQSGEVFLRLCPFCGSSRLENLDAAADGEAVMCIDCGACGPCSEKRNGFKGWNKRRVAK